MENLKQHFKEFCEETSLNGWFFIAKDGLSWTRKYIVHCHGGMVLFIRISYCWIIISHYLALCILSILQKHIDVKDRVFAY